MTKIKARDNPLHWRWSAMKQRCYNPNNKKFPRYGGRGIKVCDDWLSFESFEKWSLENGYQKDLSLDRINTDGNYEPRNCRWVDQKTQQNNRNNNRKLIHRGEVLTIDELSKETGLHKETIAYRIENDISIGRKRNFNHLDIEMNGEVNSLRYWCTVLDLPYKTIYARINRGWDPIKAIQNPIRKGNYT